MHVGHTHIHASKTLQSINQYIKKKSTGSGLDVLKERQIPKMVTCLQSLTLNHCFSSSFTALLLPTGKGPFSLVFRVVLLCGQFVIWLKLFEHLKDNAKT